MQDGFFASLGKLVDVHTLAGVLTWIGLLTYVIGVNSGEFGMSNAKLVWGGAFLAASLGCRSFSDAISKGPHDNKRIWEETIPKAVWGVFLWCLAIRLVWCHHYGLPSLFRR